MSTVTASMIKELRERTGVGMGKCKEALEEAKGDMDLAIEILRKAGIASAVKKQGRDTNEGMICFGESPDAIALVEVNSETDFVAKNDVFKQFVAEITSEIAKTSPSSLEAFLKQPYSKDPSLTIDQYRSIAIQKIGENIQIKRFAVYAKTNDTSIGCYSHMGGKIVTLVEIKGSKEEEELAKSIAMHTAAAAPDYLNPEQVPQEVIVQEREIAKSQIKGKPENIIDKIVDGKINSFYDQVCLSRQKYVKDDSLTITDLIQQRAKVIGKSLLLTNFARWSVGT